MPLLLFMMLALLINSFTLEGFRKGFDLSLGFTLTSSSQRAFSKPWGTPSLR